MNRRPLVALAMLLSGCVTTAHYEWYADPNQGPMDYYRWVVVERSTMPHVCGYLPAEHGACAIRLNQGILKPTDKPLREGLPPPSGQGKLCIIQATMPEADAHNLPAQDWAMSLHAHEQEHCFSRLHNWIPGRVG